MSPLDERHLHEVRAGTLEHVEDQQDRRAIRCGLRAAPRSHAQPSLKSAKVCAPFLISDDDLAIDDRRLRQALAGQGQLREPVSKVLALTARQSDHVAITPT
jgi:hypothetical protein